MDLIQAEGKDDVPKWELGGLCPCVSSRVHMQHAHVPAVAVLRPDFMLWVVPRLGSLSGSRWGQVSPIHAKEHRGLIQTLSYLCSMRKGYSGLIHSQGPQALVAPLGTPLPTGTFFNQSLTNHRDSLESNLS